MLRRVAGHLVTSPPTPSTPPPHPTGAAPASATSALLGVVAGAAVALAASAARQRGGQQPEAEQAPADEASGTSKDPNVVKTIEELRELLPVSDAAYGANGLAGAWPGPLALNIIGHVSEPSHFSWTVHADPIAHC